MRIPPSASYPDRKFTIRVLLLAMIAALVAMGVSNGWRAPPHAEAQGPAMSLGADNGPGDTGLQFCDAPVEPSKCTAKVGEQFDILVNATVVPSGGYLGFRSAVYLSGLVYTGKACTTEVEWEDEADCEHSSSGYKNKQYHRSTNGTTSPTSFFEGTLVRLNVRCDAPGTYKVSLPMGAGILNYYIVGYIQEDVLVEDYEQPKSVGQQSLDVNGDTVPDLLNLADTLLINCLSAEISLGAGAGNISPQCNSSPKPTKCTVPFNPNNPKAGEFKLLVQANNIPAGGYGGFQSQVFFGGLTWNQRATCTDEVVWPNEKAATCKRNKGPGQGRHLALTGNIFPVPASTFTGTLVELDVHCPAAGTYQVSLPAYPSSANGTAYRDVNGALVPAVGDTLLINCVKPLGEMSLGATGNVSCNSQPKPTKCTAYFHPFNPKAGEFQLQVHANAIPFGGYLGFQTQFVFANSQSATDGLTWNQRASCADEVLWPGEVTCTRERGFVQEPVPHLIDGSAFYTAYGNGSKSTFTGTLVETDVHCPGPGTYKVSLVSNDIQTDNYGSWFETTSGQVPITTVGQQSLLVEGIAETYDIADALIINCVKAAPQISLSAKGGGVTCNTPTKPTKCTAPYEASDPQSAQFQINVNANVIPNGGYGIFQSEVFFGGLAWSQKADCTTEVVWPDEQFCLRTKGAGGQAQHFARTSTSPIPPFPKSNFVKGPLLKLNVYCTAEGAFKVSLPAYPSSANGTLYGSLSGGAIAVATVGQQSLDLNGDTVPELVDLADALTINCVSTVPTPTPTLTPTPTPTGPTPTPTKQPPPGDTDGDGCTDQAENGPNQALGGRRNYKSFWDFMDQWIGGSRDRVVSGGDISAVVARFGSVGNPNGNPLTPPIATTGYHTIADRNGSIPGEDPWDLNPPNGSISGGDIGVVVVQFLHNCS